MRACVIVRVPCSGLRDAARVEHVRDNQQVALGCRLRARHVEHSSEQPSAYLFVLILIGREVHIRRRFKDIEDERVEIRRGDLFCTSCLQ